MEPIIKTYTVKVLREAGNDPITGEFVEYGEQSFNVDATNSKAAFSLSYFVCTLRFLGQLRRTFINGKEYFDERF